MAKNWEQASLKQLETELRRLHKQRNEVREQTMKLNDIYDRKVAEEREHTARQARRENTMVIATPEAASLELKREEG